MSNDFYLCFFFPMRLLITEFRVKKKTFDNSAVHWRSQKFLLGWGKMEKSCDVVLMTYWRRNYDDVILIFLKFDFVMISLKHHNLAKSYNFRSPKSKVKG